MVKVQIDIPTEINKKIELYKTINDCKDKRLAIIQLLKEYFKTTHLIPKDKEVKE